MQLITRTRNEDVDKLNNRMKTYRRVLKYYIYKLTKITVGD